MVAAQGENMAHTVLSDNRFYVKNNDCDIANGQSICKQFPNARSSCVSGSADAARRTTLDMYLL